MLVDPSSCSPNADLILWIVIALILTNQSHDSSSIYTCAHFPVAALLLLWSDGQCFDKLTDTHRVSCHNRYLFFCQYPFFSAVLISYETERRWQKMLQQFHSLEWEEAGKGGQNPCKLSACTHTRKQNSFNGSQGNASDPCHEYQRLH